MSGKHLSILVHFVWSTAGREPWLAAEWRDRLYAYLGGILDHKKAKLLCAGGLMDHVHLYVSLPSTISLAEIVNATKANSSGWIHRTFPHGVSEETRNRTRRTIPGGLGRWCRAFSALRCFFGHLSPP
jgi:REP element-mobilizing transposase RayT